MKKIILVCALAFSTLSHAVDIVGCLATRCLWSPAPGNLSCRYSVSFERGSNSDSGDTVAFSILRLEQVPGGAYSMSSGEERFHIKPGSISSRETEVYSREFNTMSEGFSLSTKVVKRSTQIRRNGVFTIRKTESRGTLFRQTSETIISLNESTSQLTIERKTPNGNRNSCTYNLTHEHMNETQAPVSANSSLSRENPKDSPSSEPAPAAPTGSQVRGE